MKRSASPARDANAANEVDPIEKPQQNAGAAAAGRLLEPLQGALFAVMSWVMKLAKGATVLRMELPEDGCDIAVLRCVSGFAEQPVEAIASGDDDFVYTQALVELLL
jgi:hypothetical protein